jgi:gliding motility-associated-like protein
MTANSSPRFTNYPPLLLCNNEDLVFDHSATDPDGDQLVYSLVQPAAGANSFNPAPNPSPPPPYPPVQWAAGHSTANPLGPGASISIDPNTGLLTASPNLTGLFVVGIKVDEYRNGVLLNSTIRDFLFRVFNCNLQLEALLPDQEDLPGFVSYCQGLTVAFENNSYGGTNYAWDFGVPGITSDVSSAFEPTYTYPAPGVYQAMLVVNPGWPCTDTAYMDINVNNELEVTFDFQDSLCIFGNSFDFVASSNAPVNVNYSWNFGATGNPGAATGQVVNGISFNSSGLHAVVLTGEQGVCVDTFTDSVFIFPEPIAEIVLPPNVECEGLNIQFGNNSQNATTYQWNFGDPGTLADSSNNLLGNYNYPSPGAYTVTLIAGSTATCFDTTDVTIELREPILLSFNSQDSMCITNNSFDFDATVSGPPNTIYTWNFSPFANPSTSNAIDVNGVSFNMTGSIPITLSGSDGVCFESISGNVYLYREPTIDFYLKPGLQCVPFLAEFVDQSAAETGISYLWSFGDGQFSTEQNPSHLYTEVGNYPVNLTISTSSGCVTTLNLLQADIVNVRPNPTAGFILSTDYTDICNSSIAFQNSSSGAVSYFYWFDDSTSYSLAENPSHLYLYSGTHYPYQIVTNEWGCKDTTSAKLFIEPYTFYAPNTITPDGDEHNNTFLTEAYLGVVDYQIRIFDRWGSVVFSSNDIFEPWDGVLPNGMPAQDGTYVYRIELKSCEPIKNEKLITGHINVLR